jgi:hypothetical protein
MTNFPSGGTFTSDQGTDIVFVGQIGKLILDNVMYANIVGYSMQGYLTSDEWAPVPPINISRTRMYYSVTQDYSITFKGLNLGYINGGNLTVKPSWGIYAGYLATINIQYS